MQWKWHILEIGPSGQKVTGKLSPADVVHLLAEANVSDPPQDAMIDIDLHLLRSDESVFVRGTIHGQFTVECSRCLGPATVALEEEPLMVTFLPKPNVDSDDEERELAIDDLDTFTHDGDEVDLLPMVREHIILSIPMAPLCQETCAGLCPVCGNNRNQATCDCALSASDGNKWLASLEALKKQMNS